MAQPVFVAYFWLPVKTRPSHALQIACGVFGNTLRILVPLTASHAIVEEGLDILERSLADIQEGRAAAE